MSEQHFPERLRLFIALPVPESIKDQIEKVQSELQRKLADATIRWATRDQFHLTLRFLGHVPVDVVDGLVDAVRARCAEFPPLDLRAQGLGCFPRVRSPRVIWVGVKDEAEALQPLQRAIQTSTLPFTSEVPEDRFSAHVTLGRVKNINRTQTEALAGYLAERGASPFDQWTATEVEIMRSQLSPKGSKYSVMAAAPLAGEKKREAGEERTT